MIKIIVNDTPFGGNIKHSFSSGSQLDIQIQNIDDDAVFAFLPLENAENGVEVYISKNLIFTLYEMIKKQEQRKIETTEQIF